ncbi:hook-length control protein FliK [Hathewaya proteolytica DSM 3090]|uniref:Hook-length control protein FliK n=1 Tax=Hathewaya proteolytica DSM 3090 TaxID=1121331 RepID=A0A1M6LA87_9CLOT|nr:flagellar hook-length control protein FliK [Hathewaya proteolytica]SHJ68121.1 hook-length control protein FliK [Hathewaya proteolytica DSM 3090]
MINISTSLSGHILKNSKSNYSSESNTGEEFAKVLSKGNKAKQSRIEKNVTKADDDCKTSDKSKAGEEANISKGINADEGINVNENEPSKDVSPQCKDKNKSQVEEEFSPEDISIISHLLGVPEVKIRTLLEGILNESDNMKDIGMDRFDFLQIVMENMNSAEEGTLIKLGDENTKHDGMLFELFSKGTKGDIVDYVKGIVDKTTEIVAAKDTPHVGPLINDFKSLHGEFMEEINKKLEVVDKTSLLGIQGDDKKFSNGYFSAEQFANKGDKTTRSVDSHEVSFLKSIVSESPKKSSTIDNIKINPLVEFKSYASFDANVGEKMQGENLTIRKENIQVDIIKSVRLMNLSNMKELTLKVIPKELGELVITVSSENGILKANIKASTKEGYELMQNNAEFIKEKLGNENMKIQEFSVDIYDQNSTTGNKENFRHNENMNYIITRKNGSRESLIEDMDISEELQEDDYGVLNMLA